MDLLIIKKTTSVQIRNEMGHIFKTYNVVEYKSPDDGLTIDDYIKTIGYACLYKSRGETVNRIPLREVTVSLFRDSYPRELMETLKRDGYQIEKRFGGIYYVRGDIPFDSQIVVTSQLDPKSHFSLQVLSKQAGEEAVRAFLGLARTLTSPGDRDNIDAVLQVSIAANRTLYEQIRRDSVMCQALRELMKEEIAQEMQKGCEEAREKGRTEGRAEGNILTLYGLYSDGDITLQKAAARAGMSEPAFLEAAKKISGM